MDDENDRPHYQTGTRASRIDFLKAWEQDRQFLKKEKEKKKGVLPTFIYMYMCMYSGVGVVAPPQVMYHIHIGICACSLRPSLYLCNV